MSASRYDITFAGQVQGVGFRFTAVRVAEQFDVAGWVRNEPDGTVRCVVEGERAELDRFVQAIEQQMRDYIRDTRIDQGAAIGEFGQNTGVAIR